MKPNGFNRDSSPWIRTLAALSFALVSISSVPDAHAGSCSFTIQGTVNVESRLHDDMGSALIPLQDIEIKVSGSKKYGWWNSWGTTTTNSSGEFSLKKFKSGSACKKGRYIKVEARFDGDDFKVKPCDWYVLVDRKDVSIREKVYPGTTAFGDFTFVGPDGVGPFDLDDFIAWSHATIWALYSEVLGWFADLGSSYAFNDKFSVKYPVDSIMVGDKIESSYSSPRTGNIHIIKNTKKDAFTMFTLLHELMHTWIYQHDEGKTGLTADLLTSWNTHQAYEDTNIAFHEGFPTFAAYELMNELYGYSGSKLEPYSRTYIYDNLGLTDYEDVDHNDHSWASIFRVLVANRIYRYDFGWIEQSFHFPTSWMPSITMHPPSTGIYADPVGSPMSKYPSSCDEASWWSLDFQDILRVFLPKASAGYDDHIRKSEMNIEDFLQRAADILDNFNEAQAEAVKAIVDPEETLQPYDIMDCSPMTIDIKVPFGEAFPS